MPNGNLDPTYTGLAPLSERQEEAVSTGLNPNQFVFAEEPPPPEPEEDAKAAPKKKRSWRKKKDADADSG